MGKVKTKKLGTSERKQLLKMLVYEKVKGKPIYYKDYKRVLKGELPPEAVMGSGELQSLIVRLIVELLFRNLNMDKYEVLFNEIGFKASKGSIRSLDIAIFRRESLKSIQSKYTTAVPEVVIEVDTKADLLRYGSLEAYIYEKIQDLLNAGVKKVIWILTKPKKVLIAEQDKKWITQGIEEDIEVLENIKFRIPRLFEERGYKLW